MRMLSGLCNAPGLSQRTMNVIFTDVVWQFALVYFDAVVVFLKSLKKHFLAARNVLTLLNDAGVTFKHKRCKFFAKTIHYPKHFNRPRRLEIASHTTDAICKFQPLTYLTKL